MLQALILGIVALGWFIVFAVSTLGGLEVIPWAVAGPAVAVGLAISVVGILWALRTRRLPD